MIVVKIAINRPIGEQANVTAPIVSRFGGKVTGNDLDNVVMRVVVEDPTELLAYVAQIEGATATTFEMPSWLPAEHADMIERTEAKVWPATKAEAEKAVTRGVALSGAAGANQATCSQDGWLVLAENVQVVKKDWKMWTIELTDAEQILLQEDGERGMYRLKLFAAGLLRDLYVYNAYSPQRTIIRVMKERAKSAAE